jgi:uncharacterized membrane protein
MHSTLFLAIVMIGLSAGLRTFTAPAVVAWCAYLGCVSLGQAPFSFVGSPIAVVIFSLLAAGEYVWDVLPNTPSRTAAPGLIGRTLTGAFTATCMLAASETSLAFSLLGSIAAIVGAYVGLWIRTRLVTALKTRDVFVAIPEDIVAIGISIAAVCIAAI